MDARGRDARGASPARAAQGHEARRPARYAWQGLLGEDEGSTRRVNWLAVRVRASGEHRDAALNALFAAGSRAVEEIGEELRTYLPLETDPRRLADAVAAASPGAGLEA